MAKLASQKGTGKQGERVYRKRKGGYQKAYIGGPRDIIHHNRDARDYRRAFIRELKSDGCQVHVEYFTRRDSYGFSTHDSTRLEIWRVDGCDWVIVPSSDTVISWARLVRRLGLESQRWDDLAARNFVPAHLRGRPWESLTVDEKADTWIWRWNQGITAK